MFVCMHTTDDELYVGFYSHLVYMSVSTSHYFSVDCIVCKKLSVSFLEQCGKR